MLNNMYVNGIKILNVTGGDINLENGTIVKKSKTPVEVECSVCKKLCKIKSIYGGKYSPLKRKHKCFTCNKMGAKNPFYGKKHTEEFKKNLSDQRKGTWYVGKKNSMYGVNVWDSYSEERKKQIKEKLKTFCGEKAGFYGHHTSEENKKKTSERLKKLWKEKREFMLSKLLPAVLNQKWRMTSIERIIKYKLKDLGFINKYNKILHQKYQYDFMINDNILLEVQGDYWHANPNIYDVNGNDSTKKSLTERQKFKINQDKLKQEFAIKYGFKIFYIWETDINDGNFSVLNQIRNLINESDNKI